MLYFPHAARLINVLPFLLLYTGLIESNSHDEGHTLSSNVVDNLTNATILDVFGGKQDQNQNGEETAAHGGSEWVQGDTDDGHGGVDCEATSKGAEQHEAETRKDVEVCVCTYTL